MVAAGEGERRCQGGASLLVNPLEIIFFVRITVICYPKRKADGTHILVQLIVNSKILSPIDHRCKGYVECRQTKTEDFANRKE